MVVESIKKAREKGVSDAEILQEIRKQNPEKETFFKKAQERGADPTKILDEIIKQNTPQKEKQSPASSPSQPPSPVKEPSPFKKAPPSPEEESKPPQKKPSFLKGKSEKSSEGKTLLTKETQEKEEEMRQQFLKRIEAKEKGEDVGGEGFFSTESFSPDKAEENSGKEMTNTEEPVKTNFSKIIIIGAGILVLAAAAFFLFTFL